MTKRKKLGAILLGAILALGVGVSLAPLEAVTTRALTTYEQVASISEINTVDTFKLGFEYNASTYFFDGTIVSKGLNFSTTLATAGDVKFESGENGYKIKNGTNYIHYNSGTDISLATTSTAEWNFFVTNGSNSLPIAHYNSNRFIGRASGTATYAKAYAASGFATYPAVFVYKSVESSDIVTVLSVNPLSKSLMTNAVLLEADYSVTITKNGSAGSSADYTAQIGTGTGSGFVGSNIVWGTTTPKLTDTTIQFRAKYPQTSGGSTFLTTEVALTVSAPAATSVDVTAAGGASSVKVGKKLQLSAEVQPFGANQTVVWSSSNTSFATVDSSSGLVIGVAAGDVVITATSTTPGIKGTIELNIPVPVIYDATETFENHLLTGSTYNTGSFVGDEGITVNYADARQQDVYGIDDKGIMFRNTAGYISLELPNGISAVKFDWRKAFTGAGNRQLGVLINGIQIAATPANDIADEIQTFEYTFAQPYSGVTVLKIANLQSFQVVIDNLEWNNGPALSFGTLESLTVNADSVKTSYFEGESLSLTGLVAMAVDTEGREKNVTNEITSDPAEGYVFKATDAGDKTITISYTEGKEVSDSFVVTVIAIISPEDIVADVGTKYSGVNDSGTVIPLDTDLKEAFIGNKIDLLESAVVKADPGDEQSRMYYAGTSNIKGGIQPLKFGSGSGMGNVKFTFSDEISIAKVTLYVARLGTGATVAKMQVNDAAAQNIGKASTVDAMYTPYEFTGSFGHELTVRSDSKIATYLYGIDIQTSTDKDVVDHFVDEYMLMDVPSLEGLGTGECTTLGYYADAKAAFNILSSTQRALFVSDEDYDAPRARLVAWAVANGDILNTSTKLLETPVKEAQNVLFNGLNDSNTIMLIVIISLIGVSVLGGVFYLRKREQN